MHSNQLTCASNFFEWFAPVSSGGGTVNLQHVLVTGAADDSVDWDWGWNGKVQFAIIQQHGDVGDNGFEGDNNGSAQIRACRY